MSRAPRPRADRDPGLPARIVRIRTRLGLPQRAFARRLGVSPNVVSRWERGHQRPRPGALRRIAALGGVTVDSLQRGRHREASRGLSPAQLTGALALTPVLLRWVTALRNRRELRPTKIRRSK